MPSVVRRTNRPAPVKQSGAAARANTGNGEDYDPNFQPDTPDTGPAKRQAPTGPRPFAAPLSAEEMNAVIKAGWSGHDEVKRDSSAFTQNLKLSDEPVLVKILDDEPALVFLQHWVERPGKKGWVCLKKTQKGCPLCDLGDRPREQVLFNVVLMGHVPEIRPWVLGVKGAEALKKKSLDPRKGPLTKHYWELSSSGGGKGKGGTVNYDFESVRVDSIQETWGVEPLTAEQVEKFNGQRLGVESIGMSSYETLEEVAAEITQFD